MTTGLNTNINIMHVRHRELVPTSTTPEEIGKANLLLACRELRARKICVGSDENLVTTEHGEIYLADADMYPVILLGTDPAIASLLDAGNTLLHGGPLRPLIGSTKPPVRCFESEFSS